MAIANCAALVLYAPNALSPARAAFAQMTFTKSSDCTLDCTYTLFGYRRTFDPSGGVITGVPPTGDVDRDLRPAVTLVSAWISQLSRRLQIDTMLLATRNDVEALLRGDENARLTRGWRADVVGQDIRRLVEGRAALSFDGHGGLVLEDR